MSEAAGARAAVLLKRFVLFVVLVGLAGAVAWLLSERNHRSFAVEQRGNELIVLRGRMFPTGYRDYEPTERVLAEAYAPIPIGGETSGLLLQRFDDRDDLDHALFDALSGWAEPRLQTDDPERLREALRYVDRAAKLPGLGDEQRKKLKDLQARVAFFEGRNRLEEAVTSLREAVSRLKLASESRTRYARDAGELYERVAGPTEQLSHALRLPLTSAGAQTPLEPIQQQQQQPPAPTSPAPAPSAPPAAAPTEPAPPAAPVDAGAPAP